MTARSKQTAVKTPAVEARKRRFEMYGTLLIAELLWVGVYYTAPWNLPVATYKAAVFVTLVLGAHLLDRRAFRTVPRNSIERAAREIARGLVFVGAAIVAHGL